MDIPSTVSRRSQFHTFMDIVDIKDYCIKTMKFISYVLRDGMDPRQLRDGMDPRQLRDGMDPRQLRDGMDPRQLRDGMDPRQL